MNDTRTKWEPSDEVVNAAYDECMRHVREGDDGVVTTQAMRAAIIAAVEADPLLRAAGGMKIAIDAIANWPITDRSGNQDAVNMAIVARRARGESQ